MCLMLTCQCVRTQISAGIWQLLIQEVAQLDRSRGSDLLSGVLLGGAKGLASGPRFCASVSLYLQIGGTLQPSPDGSCEPQNFEVDEQ